MLSTARSLRVASRSVGLAVGLLAAGWLLARPAQASPSAPMRATYATTGTIDSAGVTGPARVRFVGASGATDSGAAFDLGGFAIDPASGGGATTYDRTPVTIDLWAKAVAGVAPNAADGSPAGPAVVRGWLSGTVGGAGPTALSVLFDQGIQPDDPRFYQPHPLPPLPAGSGGVPGYLGFNHGASLLTLDPAGGMTPVAAQLDLATPTPTPEPTSLLIFAAGAAGVVLARRWRRRDGR